MKILFIYLIFSSLSAFSLEVSHKDLWMKSTDQLKEYSKRDALGLAYGQTPEGQQVDYFRLKRLEEDLYDYYVFVARNVSGTSVSFENFRKNPDKHWRELHNYNYREEFNRLKQNPNDSFSFCKKSPLEDITCPEGVYIFIGEKKKDSVNNEDRGQSKENGHKNHEQKSTSSKQ